MVALVAFSTHYSGCKNCSVHRSYLHFSREGWASKREKAEEWNQHLQGQQRDRLIYYHTRWWSRRQRNVLCIIIDSLDKAKVRWPRYGFRMPKCLDDLIELLGPQLACHELWPFWPALASPCCRVSMERTARATGRSPDALSGQLAWHLWLGFMAPRRDQCSSSRLFSQHVCQSRWPKAQFVTAALQWCTHGCKSTGEPKKGMNRIG